MIRWLLVAAILALVAIFVVVTGEELPPTVASHFGAGGRANGFMGRDAYVAFMAAMAVGIPLLVALGGSLARWLPSRLVNLPDRDHWLAPERRAETLAAVELRMTVFACALAVFLAWVHWLVVEANAARPPRLDEESFIAALVVFVAFSLGWSAAFYLRFRRSGRR